MKDVMISFKEEFEKLKMRQFDDIEKYKASYDQFVDSLMQAFIGEHSFRVSVHGLDIVTVDMSTGNEFLVASKCYINWTGIHFTLADNVSFLFNVELEEPDDPNIPITCYNFTFKFSKNDERKEKILPQNISFIRDISDCAVIVHQVATDGEHAEVTTDGEYVYSEIAEIINEIIENENSYDNKFKVMRAALERADGWNDYHLIPKKQWKATFMPE